MKSTGELTAEIKLCREQIAELKLAKNQTADAEERKSLARQIEALDVSVKALKDERRLAGSIEREFRTLGVGD